MDSAEILLTLFRISFALMFALTLVPILVFMERKIASYIQDRPGPNRTNIGGIRLSGIIQSLADVVKLVFKEDFISGHIKKRFYFVLAPALLFFMSLMTISIIPFADDFILNGKAYIMQAIPIDAGMLWYLGFAGLSVYGIILAGYAADNKYALLGSLRASAQAISYEIPLALSVVSMLITYGSIHLNDFVHFQEGTFFGVIPMWGVFIQPLAAVIFIVTIFAETNRAPFDLAEGESEIVAGFHTEYSAMRFALFFMAEYIAMIVASAMIVTVFFGGYSLPWVSTQMLLDNSEFVLIVIAIIVPIKIFLFTSWLLQNNKTRYKTEHDLRKKENSFYIKLVLTIALLIEIPILYILSQGVSAFDGQIIATTVQTLVFVGKTLIMLFVFIWVRWTLPRFRYDQLQRMCWEKLIPLAIFNIVVTAIFVVAIGGI